MVNRTLLELNMSYNDIGDDGITAIAGSLNKSSIVVLNVEWCKVSFIGVRSVAVALATNQNIRELRLWGNPCTVDGARLIMKSTVDNGVCEYVSINDEYEDDDVVMKMKTTLENRKSQYVGN